MTRATYTPWPSTYRFLDGSIHADFKKFNTYDRTIPKSIPYLKGAFVFVLSNLCIPLTILADTVTGLAEACFCLMAGYGIKNCISVLYKKVIASPIQQAFLFMTNASRLCSLAISRYSSVVFSKFYLGFPLLCYYPAFHISILAIRFFQKISEPELSSKDYELLKKNPSLRIILHNAVTFSLAHIGSLALTIITASSFIPPAIVMGSLALLSVYKWSPIYEYSQRANDILPDFINHSTYNIFSRNGVTIHGTRASKKLPANGLAGVASYKARLRAEEAYAPPPGGAPSSRSTSFYSPTSSPNSTHYEVFSDSVYEQIYKLPSLPVYPSEDASNLVILTFLIDFENSKLARQKILDQERVSIEKLPRGVNRKIKLRLFDEKCERIEREHHAYLENFNDQFNNTSKIKPYSFRYDGVIDRIDPTKSRVHQDDYMAFKTRLNGNRSCYHIFNLPESTSAQEFSDARKRYIRALHPDKVHNHHRKTEAACLTSILNEAYENLPDDKKLP